MSKHKNALDRYLILDGLLSRKYNRFTLTQLLDRLNEALLERGLESIGRTQLYKDLAYLENSDYQAPITRKNDGTGHKVIYYSDPNYTIRKQALSEDEAATLKTMLDTLGRFKGLGELRLLEELSLKLQQEFGLEQSGKHYISFEDNAYLKGSEYLKPLLDAITEEAQLSIDYQPFKEAERTFDISPYHLKRYNQRWFLFGKTADFTTLTIVPLDRIVSIGHSPTPYIPNTDIDFEAYFDDMIGVTRPDDGKVEEICLEFTPKQAPYVLTKPLHPSQKQKLHENGSLTVRIWVMPNYELESLILSFGERVKVLGPEELKEKIKKRIL